MHTSDCTARNIIQHEYNRNHSVPNGSCPPQTVRLPSAQASPVAESVASAYTGMPWQAAVSLLPHVPLYTQLWLLCCHHFRVPTPSLLQVPLLPSALTTREVRDRLPPSNRRWPLVCPLHLRRSLPRPLFLLGPSSCPLRPLRRSTGVP